MFKRDDHPRSPPCMYAPTVPTELSASLRARVEACIPPLHGWTTVDKGVRLAELVVSTQAALSVELGVFGGRGTISLAIGHEALMHGYVVAVDPWERAASLDGVNAPENADWWGKLDHEAIYQSFLRALADSGTASLCRVLRQRSDVAVEGFEDRSIGVLHQDSNHSEQISSAEVQLWAPKLRAGGLWIADDTDWPTTQRAQALLVEKGFAPMEDHASWKVFRKDR
jgi:methyltransferase family protein